MTYRNEVKHSDSDAWEFCCEWDTLPQALKFARHAFNLWHVTNASVRTIDPVTGETFYLRNRTPSGIAGKEYIGKTGD